ncbi:hydrogenase large subunit [Anaeromyxobacter oryzisoli]|uniref:hydrogenase large subunit n=1 Tax=Anaeromyxobacter oryzisoli TaxID=2925408 RepID=UPI001F5941B1|nr:hydrogenase [Anaeromyxobacter sp. SG63]
MTTASTLLAPVRDLAAGPREFFDRAAARLAAGARPVTFYGQPADDPASLTLTLVLEEEGRLSATRTAVSREKGFHALTRKFPALHAFEREIFEAHGVKPHDHPWLKPVRFSGPEPRQMDRYPFYVVEGAQVHEVAVGPIHAGVIEPGHFRFMCLGEVVHHLEIQLGYQHRGVERLLLQREPRALAPLVETIAGDSSVAHAWAYCDALEALAGLQAGPDVEASRALGLELERIAMHLGGLSGIAGDLAFLQGAATYGRLRTTAINTSMLVCGSRFGRGWARPGALRPGVDAEKAAAIRAALALLARDVAIVNEHLLSARSVQHRLHGVGVVRREQALEIGLVGLAARASGVACDARASLPGDLHAAHPVRALTERSGDCWARTVLRIREIDASIRWLGGLLDAHPALAPSAAPLGALAPDTLAVALREGWRGEVVHCLETDGQGRLRHYAVQDPSLRNWLGLALAVRGNEISDFPICNKSFDLSYCGNDL